MLHRINIESQLQNIRIKDPECSSLERLLEKCQIGLLPNGEPSETSGGADRETTNTFDFDSLDTDRIYHIGHIRQICIDYRLRFLDLTYFKPPVPEEALEAINLLERQHNTRLEGLKIIAPSRLFRLEDRDDPLLFVPLGNDYFYLVHKWGNDLHPLRRWLVWPFRNIGNLTLLVLLISYLVTLMVPGGLFSNRESQAEFWIIFFFMFKSIAAVVIFYGFALGKNFNPAIWNSKYCN